MWRRRKSKPQQDESPAVEKARAAAEDAEERRRSVEERWVRVNEITAELSAALKRNHFGEQITKAALRKASP